MSYQTSCHLPLISLPILPPNSHLLGIISNWARHLTQGDWSCCSKYSNTKKARSERGIALGPSQAEFMPQRINKRLSEYPNL
ncbi:Uncharacterised protein [Vibrio cholerae]|nr:Uncharacterised protein [Vibrio cholerae]